MADLHEKRENLREETLDTKRAIDSLREELEAIDWYQQRADATDDDALYEIMVHNKEEEMEHAAMAIEWLRRRDERFDEILNQYLNTEGDIVDLEESH